VTAHVKEDWTGSKLANAKKEGVERCKQRGNGTRGIGGRGTMEKEKDRESSSGAEPIL